MISASFYTHAYLHRVKPGVFLKEISFFENHPVLCTGAAVVLFSAGLVLGVFLLTAFAALFFL